MALEDRPVSPDLVPASSPQARLAAVARRLTRVDVLLDTMDYLHALGRFDMARAARVRAGKLLESAERELASIAYGPAEERRIP